jgi:tripartite-type tricarboxylate transporter receptor subunit TctC
MNFSGRILFVAIVGSMPHACAWAQNYPAKAIRLVVPFPAGGVTDLIARLVGPKAAELLGQPVVIDNRGGAGGTIGANNVAKSAPDGYTLLLMGGGHTLAPNLYAKLPYDIVRDFAPISILAKTIYVLTVHPSLPAKSVKELIAIAKARPGALSYASTGVGNLGHLSAEMFAAMADIKMTHVPYKGDSPAVADLLGGQVELGFLLPLSSRRTSRRPSSKRSA